MIQANELRIGNIVKMKFSENDFSLITGINEDDVSLNEVTLDYIETNDIEPIPLTEEWLLKFGATEIISFNDGYKRFNLDGIQLSISPYDRDWFVEYVHQTPIKYVHTLQNFYFANKQKELA